MTATGGARRLRRAGAAAAAGLVLAVAAPAAAWAIPVDPGDSPCLGSTGSVTFSRTRMVPGLSVTVSWSTSRPAGCGLVSMLTGPNVSKLGNEGGAVTVTPGAVGDYTYTASVIYPGGHTDVASATLHVTAQLPYVPAAAWATPGGTVAQVDEVLSPAPSRSGLVAAPGTSPATADYFTGGQATAVHAADTGTLKYTDVFSTVVDSHAVMAAGSSPSVAASNSAFDGSQAAFAGADNLLRTVDTKHDVVSLVAGGRAVSPGTNPAIAHGVSGYAVAYRASGANTLWWVDPFGAAHDTGLRTAAGASPSITGLLDASNNFRIVFVRDTGFPAVYDTATTSVRDFPVEAVADNTSPAIGVIPNIPGVGYELTFVGRDDHALWRDYSGATPSASTHIPVAAGTAPSMAFITGSYQVLVNNPVTGTIWQYLGDGNQRDTHAPIAAGTSPSNANGGDAPATATPVGPAH